MSPEYTIIRTQTPPQLSGAWNGQVWRRAQTAELRHYMGEQPEHFPLTQVKLCYDDDKLYVIFRVQDRYLLARAQKHQDHVCRDSCVEFFFTPGPDISQGYFNLEMNCGGTMLMYHQLARSEQQRSISLEDLEGMEVFRSEKRIIDPEEVRSSTWFVEYALRYAMLEKYANVRLPGPGVVWRGNFYKCADASSHPHWLTWAKVKKEKPDFHRPEFFGRLEFA